MVIGQDDVRRDVVESASRALYRREDLASSSSHVIQCHLGCSSPLTVARRHRRLSSSALEKARLAVGVDILWIYPRADDRRRSRCGYIRGYHADTPANSID